MSPASGQGIDPPDKKGAHLRREVRAFCVTAEGRDPYDARFLAASDTAITSLLNSRGWLT